jgi:hypothetical protein
MTSPPVRFIDSSLCFYTFILCRGQQKSTVLRNSVVYYATLFFECEGSAARESVQAAPPISPSERQDTVFTCLIILTAVTLIRALVSYLNPMANQRYAWLIGKSFRKLTLEKNAGYAGLYSREFTAWTVE